MRKSLEHAFVKNIEKGNQKGQALLIILLVMSVILTVVLSVVSKSVTDISITTSEKDAFRAFSAAEAGVEEALLKDTSTGGTSVTLDPTSNASYSTNITTPLVDSNRFIYPKDLKSGETATFWFVNKDLDGRLFCDPASGKPCFRGSQIEVCWGDPSLAENSAIEVALYYDTTFQSVANPNNLTGMKVYKDNFDKEHTTRGNNFSGPGSGCSLNSVNFKFTTSNLVIPAVFGATCTNTPGCFLTMSVKMLYNSSPQPVALRVTSGGGTKLPSQGTVIESTGVAGDSTRRINVFKSHPEAPDVFNTALYSLRGLDKP